MVMEHIETKKNRKQYHGGCCCCRDLLHVIMWAMYLLILLTTIPTSIPHVAAAERYYFPSSNVNDSLFSYYAIDPTSNYGYNFAPATTDPFYKH